MLPVVGGCGWDVGDVKRDGFRKRGY